MDETLSARPNTDEHCKWSSVGSKEGTLTIYRSNKRSAEKYTWDTVFGNYLENYRFTLNSYRKKKKRICTAVTKVSLKWLTEDDQDLVMKVRSPVDRPLRNS